MVILDSSHFYRKSFILLFCLFTPFLFNTTSLSQWRIATGTSGNNIAALDIFHHNSDTLFAIGLNSTIRSVDRGEHWDSIAPFKTDIGAIRIDPSDPKIVYISHIGHDLESNDVSKTTDGGTTWNYLPFSGRIYPVAVIEFDPLDFKKLYVGNGPSFVYRTVDHGQTWTQMNTPDINYLTSIAIDPINDSVLYLGYVDGVFKSTDGGNTWDSLSPGFTIQGSTKITIDPLHSNTIYAARYSYTDTVPSGLYKSTDGGSTWVEKNNGLSGDKRRINTIIINPKNTDEIFLGLDDLQNPIVRTINGGDTWVNFSAGLPNSYVSSFAIDTIFGKLYCNASNFNYPESSGVYILDSIVTDVKNRTFQEPRSFVLYQNYPNPFNPTTEIHYNLPEASHVRLVVYDVLGREVMTLIDAFENAGYKSAKVDGNGLSTGLYFYRMEAGKFIDVKKMLLIK